MWVRVCEENSERRVDVAVGLDQSLTRTALFHSRIEQELQRGAIL